MRYNVRLAQLGLRSKPGRHQTSDFLHLGEQFLEQGIPCGIWCGFTVCLSGNRTKLRVGAVCTELVLSAIQHCVDTTHARTQTPLSPPAPGEKADNGGCVPARFVRRTAAGVPTQDVLRGRKFKHPIATPDNRLELPRSEFVRDDAVQLAGLSGRKCRSPKLRSDHRVGASETNATNVCRIVSPDWIGTWWMLTRFGFAPASEIGPSRRQSTSC